MNKKSLKDILNNVGQSKSYTNNNNEFIKNNEEYVK